MSFLDEAEEVVDKLSKRDGFFNAGWRPTLGWTGVAGSVLGFIVVPAADVGQALYWATAIPEYPIEHLITLAGLALGTAGIRTFDKRTRTRAAAQIETSRRSYDKPRHPPKMPAPTFGRDEEENAPWNRAR